MGAVETGTDIMKLITGLQDTLNSTDNSEIINNGTQLAASLSTFIAKNPLTTLNANGTAAMVAIGRIQADWDHGRQSNVNDWLNLSGNILAMAAAVGLLIIPTGRAAQIMLKAAQLWSLAEVFKWYVEHDAIADEVNNNFDNARRIPPYRDPLVLDLDGDGIELNSVSERTLFDHDGDGIRTSTGWVSTDDGLLVRDINNNGIIDCGSELFGGDTPHSSTSIADQSTSTLRRNGFQALKELDSNQDNQFTELDEAWNSVKIWRDLNQDGISHSTEIFTLEELNITAISLQSSSGNSNGASNVINGNNISDHAEFTQNGENKTIGAVNFSINPFYRQYNDPLPPTDATKNLPDMRGSGLVRNLRDAATRDSALQTTLSNFSNATMCLPIPLVVLMWS
mgnify:CR=1 FL=1